MPRAVTGPSANSAAELALDPISIKKAALVIRAVNHPIRQKLLSAIHQDKKMRVTELHRTLKLVQPLVSQHIAALKAAGCLSEERQGRNTLYSVNYKRLQEIQELAGKMIRMAYCLLLLAG